MCYGENVHTKKNSLVSLCGHRHSHKILSDSLVYGRRTDSHTVVAYPRALGSSLMNFNFSSKLTVNQARQLKFLLVPRV